MRISAACLACAAALLTTGGCAVSGTAGDSWRTSSGGGSWGSSGAALVAERTRELRLPLVGGEGLSPVQKESLRTFAIGYMEDGRSQLVISRPSGDGVKDAGGAAEAARAALEAAGVGSSRISVGAYEAGGASASELILSYRIFETVIPDCPDFRSIDFANTSSNASLPSLGCAVNASFAAIIADPEDLLAQRPLDAADGARRATVLDKYRKGEPTATQRTQQASGNVSEAVGQ